jgi:Mg/Co/Ni transporter MgtE
MEKRKVEDYMILKDGMVSLDRDTPLPRAYETMKAQQLESLPVIENGRLLGIITMETAKGYLPHLSPEAVRQGAEIRNAMMETAVGDVMDHNPAKVLPETTISKVAKTMLAEETEAVSVVDQDDMWLGMIRLKDILQMVARS